MTDDKTLVKMLAEKVMDFEMKLWPDGLYAYVSDDAGFARHWDPLASDADACQVLRKIGERFPMFILRGSWDRGRWDCVLQRRETDGSLTEIEGPIANSTNKAICFAALRAVGVEVTE